MANFFGIFDIKILNFSLFYSNGHASWFSFPLMIALTLHKIVSISPDKAANHCG